MTQPMYGTVCRYEVCDTCSRPHLHVTGDCDEYENEVKEVEHVVQS